MVQIIESNRKPTTGERLQRSLAPVLEQVSNRAREMKMEDFKKKEKESLTRFMQEEYGLDTKDLPADFQKEILKGEYANKGRELTANKPTKKTQASQPIDPEQLSTIQNVRKTPGYDDMDEVQQYRTLTDAGVSKENAETEAKLTGQQLERRQKTAETSYKAQEDFITETTDKYKSFEMDTKPRLMQMQKIASDEQLIGPTSAAFMETLGIPLGALEDPSSELYQKVSLDLLKGLPETYGNKIMKIEVENFLKTIPGLLNSPAGRRMIASNMLKLGEMKEVYYNEMRRQQKDLLDSGKAFPKDFQQRVLDQVKPQIEKINDEFVKMSEIKSVPKDKIPFFYNGQIKFVPKEHAQWALETGGKRIW